MIIMAYSAFTAATIADALGAPEYSYWFVRRAFTPVLEHFGLVVPVTDPKREVDRIRAAALARGEDCVFLSFDPPHKSVLGLACRTVPVFAWEFDTIPTEAWGGEKRHDWRVALADAGSAITHSRFSRDAVRRAMGGDFPVWSIPAPVFDSHARMAPAMSYQPETALTLSGVVIDSRRMDLDAFSARRAHVDGARALLALQNYAAEALPACVLHLSGVVYTAVFNPADGRKNVPDMIGGFIWAFREVADATLILKLTHANLSWGMMPVLMELAKHGRYRCRIVLIHGLLPEGEYRALVAATSYAVNTSTNEGQCLPLMEFMSAGRPAVAPAHTSMLDYVSDANSFVVRDAARLASWPHDTRRMLRTWRHEVSLASLVRAYRESYRVATREQARYAAMSEAAVVSLRAFCNEAVVAERLAAVLGVGVAKAYGDRTELVED
jgi:hypothetical protein